MFNQKVYVYACLFYKLCYIMAYHNLLESKLVNLSKRISFHKLITSVDIVRLSSMYLSSWSYKMVS